MNIYAKEGHKVIVTEGSARNGYDHDKMDVERYLEIGKVYTVEETVVGGWHTRVFLKEVPNIAFNSVNLEDYQGENKRKYIVAQQCGGVMEDPKIWYREEQIIEANSPKEACKIYNKINKCVYYYGTCLGIVCECGTEIKGDISKINYCFSCGSRMNKGE